MGEVYAYSDASAIADGGLRGVRYRILRGKLMFAVWYDVWC